MRIASVVLGVVAAVAVAIQLVPVDRSNPPENGPLVIQDAAVADVFDRACADCHTNGTTWPWYSKVAPVSWWVVDHVEEGREHLNLSTWASLSADDQDHKLEEWVEMVEEGEMPLPSYTWGHPEARLSDQERETLMAWARAQRADLGVSGSGEGESGESHEEGERGQ